MPDAAVRPPSEQFTQQIPDLSHKNQKITSIPTHQRKHEQNNRSVPLFTVHKAVLKKDEGPCNNRHHFPVD